MYKNADGKGSSQGGLCLHLHSNVFVILLLMIKLNSILGKFKADKMSPTTTFLLTWVPKSIIILGIVYRRTTQIDCDFSTLCLRLSYYYDKQNQQL